MKFCSEYTTGQEKPFIFDGASNELTDTKVSNLIIKKKAEGSEVEGEGEKTKVEPGKKVNVGDIKVEYDNGKPVEDGVVFDLFNIENMYSNPEPVKYTVKDGKLSGIKMNAEEQYKIGFDNVTNDYWKKLDLLGAYKSKKLMRIYARYEGEAPLYYDFDLGTSGKEIKIEKLVVKKLGSDEESVNPVPTTAIMNLLISDNGYAADGGLPFSVIRKDNGKKKTVYSKVGELTLNCEGNVEYELILEKNDKYVMKDKIEFSVLQDSLGCSQVVIKGYDVEDPEGRLPFKPIELKRIDGKVTPPRPGTIEDNDPSRYPPDEYQIIYDKEKVSLKDFPVYEVKKNAQNAEPLNKEIKFVFYNSTTQNIEKTVKSKNGKLPTVELIKNHRYIVYAEDSDYEMMNAYFYLDKSGEQPTNIQFKGKIDGFYLNERAKKPANLKDINRVKYKLPVYKIDSKGSASPVSDIKFTFISEDDTVTATAKNGEVEFSLREDVNYTVLVNNKDLAIQSFPLAIKDIENKKYAFNHFTCGSESALYLVEKGKETGSEITLTSPSKKTTVSGLNFKRGEYLVHSRILDDMKVKALEGKDYQVLDVDCINMCWREISKLAFGNFTITTEIPDKKVKNVYYIDKAGRLTPVEFTQKGNKLSFKMKTLSIYNNVIEFDSDKYEFTKGNNSKWIRGSNKPLNFTIKFNRDDAQNGTFEKFQGIEIDGQPVDEDNYEKTPGSVNIKLNAEYLEGLENGSHTMKALFNDDMSVTTKFSIGNKNTGSVQVAGNQINGSSNNSGNMNGSSVRTVNTGDVNSIWSYGIIFFMAVLMAVYAYKRKRA